VSHGKDPCWSSSWRTAAIVRIHAGAIHEGLHPLEGTPCRSREQCAEEGAAERSCYGLTSDPIPNTPALLRGGEVEELTMKE